MSFLSFNQRLHLIPFWSKFKFLFYSKKLTYSQLFLFLGEIIGNIILFIPLPFCLYFVFGIKNYKTIFLLGFLTTVFIETVQFVFKIGVADIDDVILNCCGVLVGILVIELLERIKTARLNAKSF